MIRTRLATLALLFSPTLLTTAQQPRSGKPLNLVAPNGKGRIVVPGPSDDLQWQTINLYDEGTRPVFQLKRKASAINISFALFPNQTGSNTPDKCRDDVVDAAIHGSSPMPGMADIKQIKKSGHAPIDGQQVAVGSFLVKSLADTKIDQQNEFVVAANSSLCAEMHVSKVAFQASDESLLKAQIETFDFDPDYSPTPADYFTLGSVFYNVTKAFDSAAVYYQRALDTLPTDTPLNTKRLITDQLAMSYGISGQIKKSRAVNEAAIKTDPDYPLYYYNLACADAEQGHAADAKSHLQQAFDRKANTLPGETLPNPAKDDSFIKLKKNKDFWSFVQTLR